MMRLSWLLVAVPSVSFAQDACPTDPNKTAPGLCGCGVADSDFDGDTLVDSCIQPGATVPPSVVVGRAARVDAGATIGASSQLGAVSHVGAGASIGVGSTIAPRATVGAGTSLGPGSAVGRRATVGDDADVDGLEVAADVILGDRVSGGSGVLVGFGASVGDDVVFATNDVTVGNLASVGDGCTLRTGARVGRDASLGAGCDVGESAQVGAAAQTGTGFEIGANGHLRSHTQVGAEVSLGVGAIVGRGAQLADHVDIGSGARVGANAQLGAWAVIDPDERVPRGAVIPPGNTAPTISAITPASSVLGLAALPLSVTASDAQTPSLSYSWSFVTPSGGAFLSGAGTATPTLTAGPFPSGPLTVRATVSDGTLSTTGDVVVSVLNNPPVITGGSSNSSVGPNASLGLSVAASDADGQALGYSWAFVGSSAGASLTNPTTATPTLTVGGVGSGPYTVRATVSDGTASVTRDVTVTVALATSCNAIKGTAADVGDGVYTISPSGTAFNVYCVMNTSVAGGGWTLISNRRADTTNTESCGSNLATFFTGGCGSLSVGGVAPSASTSYALTATQRNSLPKTEMLVIQYLGGTPDTDDAYIVTLGSLVDPFPNNTTSWVTTLVPSVRGYSGTPVDSANVYWVYTGTSWYHSSDCANGFANDLSYRGNYGLCHDGVSAAYNSSSFVGNRSQYQETKLWSHPNEAAPYQERIFYR